MIATSKSAISVEVPSPSNNKSLKDSTMTEKELVSCAPEQYLTSWRLAVVILSLILGTLLVAIDTTIIGVAIPKISSVFKALDEIGWFGSAYLLTVTAFQPTFGNIYKFFDVKTTYMISILVFEVGSILCAAAPNSSIFILGRAIAGVGAAGLFQGALGIIGFSVSLDKRPLYMGVVVSSFGFAVCFGPILGGALTDRASWRWCFWINVPIGVVVLFLILFFLKLKNDKTSDRSLPLREKMQHMDFAGALLLLAAVCCLLLALQWGGTTKPWGSSQIIGLFIGFGLLTIAFGFLQWRLGENATIPLRVLRQRSILMGAWFLFFLQMSSYTNSYYVPFYFQAVQGVSATTSGIRFIALAAPQIFAVIVTGAIVSKSGYYVPFMVLGEIICVIGTGFLTRIDLATSTVEWAAFLVIAGLGLGIGMQLPYTALQVVLSETDLPTGNAIAVFSSQLGGALAISVGQSIFVNSLQREVPRRTTAVSAQAVIDAGATNLTKLTDSATVLQMLRSAYSKAVTNTLKFSLAAACVAIPCALFMEWKNVTQEAKAREQEATVTKDRSLGACA